MFGALGGLGAVARGSFKDFISWDFKALKLKVLRLEGLKIGNLIFELKAEGSKDRRIQNLFELKTESWNDRKIH